MGLAIHGGFDRSSDFLSQTHAAFAQSMQRLSTGLRVRRAADDPAGLAVAVNLSVASTSERQAMRNINDGLSMVQVAEAATGEVVDVLQRMRSLAVQGASETLDDDGRAVLHTEFTELLAEIDRVAASTEFNGQALTDGGIPSMGIQVSGGGGADSRITLPFADVRAATLGVGALGVSSVADAANTLGSLDAAIDTTNVARADYGAVFRRLEIAFDLAGRQERNLASAASVVRDTDYATETARLAGLGVQMAAGVRASAAGLRALESTASLVGSGGSGGGDGGTPLYQKGDFPEDLV